MVIMILSGLIFPTLVMASDAGGTQYEIVSWRFGMSGDTGSINVGYIGKDGSSKSLTFPLERNMYSGHETDKVWTEYDSAAPFLAYITNNGKDGNIRDVFDVTCYDPAIKKALTGQGVSLSQIGGNVNAPTGAVVFPTTKYWRVVGIGVTPSKQTTLIIATTPTPVPNPVSKPIASPVPTATPKVNVVATQQGETPASPDTKSETPSNSVPVTTVVPNGLESASTTLSHSVSTETKTISEGKAAVDASKQDSSNSATSTSWLWPIIEILGAISIVVGSIFAVKRHAKQ